jgi:Holliday junction resolvase RusA-like endonuclease
MKLTIKGRLPGLNEYVQAERSNRYMGSKMKKEYTELVAWECKRQKLKKCKPVEIIFTWYEANKKRDKDNIAFAKKFILDGLVQAGVLDSDGWKGYGDFDDRFEVDKKEPRVEIEL